jgi:hypothetical protein
MPTVLRHQGYRFYFYSHEPNEPPHIHVDQGDKSAKFWLLHCELHDALHKGKKIRLVYLENTPREFLNQRKQFWISKLNPEFNG